MTRAGQITLAWCYGSVLLTALVLIGVTARFLALAIQQLDPALVADLTRAVGSGLALSLGAVLLAALPAAAVAVAVDELLTPGPALRASRTALAVAREIPSLVLAFVVLALGLGAGWGYALVVLAAVAIPRLAEGNRAALRLARRTDRLAAASLGLSPLAIFARVIWPSTARALLASHVRSVGSTFGAAAPLLLVDPEVGALSIVAARLALDGQVGAASAAVLTLLGGVAFAHALAVAIDRPVRWRRAS